MRNDSQSRKECNYFLAIGILVHTTDEMILNGSAAPRLCKALSLVRGADSDRLEDFCTLIIGRLNNFERTHPEFPVEEFVDNLWEDGPMNWKGMDAEFEMILQEGWDSITRPGFLDRLRDQMPDAYESILTEMANDSSIMQRTLDGIS